jgi:hypothetical protein
MSGLRAAATLLLCLSTMAVVESVLKNDVFITLVELESS